MRGRSLRGAVLCRRGTLCPPAAGAAEGSPRLVLRLDALNSLCSKPLRGRLPVLYSRRRHRAVLDSWSRGFRAAVLELELPEAALSPPGRCTAEPPPEGCSSLYRGQFETSVCACQDGASPGLVLIQPEKDFQLSFATSPSFFHKVCMICLLVNQTVSQSAGLAGKPCDVHREFRRLHLHFAGRCPLASLGCPGLPEVGVAKNRAGARGP